MISRRGPTAAVDPPGDLRRDEDADGLRERRQAALERVEAAQALQVQRAARTSGR